jgi:hypothetical protein
MAKLSWNFFASTIKEENNEKMEMYDLPIYL